MNAIRLFMISQTIFSLVERNDEIRRLRKALGNAQANRNTSLNGSILIDEPRRLNILNFQKGEWIHPILRIPLILLRLISKYILRLVTRILLSLSLFWKEQISEPVVYFAGKVL